VIPIDFTIGFWHPFGPHAGEAPEAILERKAHEINATSYTLWSFQHRTTLELWRHTVRAAGPALVYVLCSKPAGARDPKAEPRRCSAFRRSLGADWEPIPPTIHVPHPMGPGQMGSAFVVKHVLPVACRPSFTVSWLRTRDNRWMHSQLPTRPEFLIRRDAGAVMRPISLVLELQEPYVVDIKP